jgi:WD40 repeat protein
VKRNMRVDVVAILILLGCAIKLEANPIKVTDVFQGSLAEAAGIMSGDYIVDIDEREFATNDEVLEYLKPTSKTYVFHITRARSQFLIPIAKTKDSFGFQFTVTKAPAAYMPAFVPPDMQRPILRIEPQGHSDSILCMVFSPNGKELITTGQDKTIRIWDVASGTQKRVLRCLIGEGGAGSIISLAIDPKGRFLACGGNFSSDIHSQIGAIRIFDYESGKIVRLLIGHKARVLSLAFSGDGHMLASGDENGRVLLWNIDQWKESAKVWVPHNAGVNAIVFSPGNREIATVSKDKSIFVFDTDSGENLLHKPQAHDGPINSVDYSPDGSLLVT